MIPTKDELKKEILKIVNDAYENDMLVEISALGNDLTNTFDADRHNKQWMELLAETLADMEYNKTIVGYEVQMSDGYTKAYGY